MESLNDKAIAAVDSLNNKDMVDSLRNKDMVDSLNNKDMCIP